MKRNYNPADALSIFQYSGRLLHSTLAQVVPAIDSDINIEDMDAEGKGGLGIW